MKKTHLLTTLLSALLPAASLCAQEGAMHMYGMKAKSMYTREHSKDDGINHHCVSELTPLFYRSNKEQGITRAALKLTQHDSKFSTGHERSQEVEAMISGRLNTSGLHATGMAGASFGGRTNSSLYFASLFQVNEGQNQTFTYGLGLVYIPQAKHLHRSNTSLFLPLPVLGYRGQLDDTWELIAGFLPSKAGLGLLYKSEDQALFGQVGLFPDGLLRVGYAPKECNWSVHAAFIDTSYVVNYELTGTESQYISLSPNFILEANYKVNQHFCGSLFAGTSFGSNKIDSDYHKVDYSKNNSRYTDNLNPIVGLELMAKW